MSNNGSQSRVLVVGAGPSGLVLGSELLRQGVQDVWVISKLKRESPHSRAVVLWPRILELLDRIGAAESMVQHGHYVNQMNYYSNRKRIGIIKFTGLQGVAYPFGITIPQWRTEKLLEENFNRLGGKVYYDLEFVSGKETESGFQVELRGSDAAALPSTFDWVVGADGYGSAVREAIGVGFEGFVMPKQLAITDAEVLGETTTCEAAYFLTKSGSMAISPLGDGVFRVAASVPDWFDETKDSPDREFFERLLSERVPGRRRLGEMRFAGVFHASVRAAEVYRKGRAFLIGDAAHAMSPSGAQAMNVGIQDAVNLGWKLAGVILGHFSPDILDTYDQERRSAVEEVTRTTMKMAKVSLYTKPTEIFARDTVYRVLTATGLLTKHFAPKLTQLDTYYGPKPDKHAWTPGERLPLGWRKTQVEPTLSIDKFTVLLWPGEAYYFATWKSLVDDISPRLSQAPAHVVDLAGRPLGELEPKLGKQPAALVARPDGHVHAVLPLSYDGHKGADAEAVLQSLPISQESFAVEGSRGHDRECSTSK